METHEPSKQYMTEAQQTAYKNSNDRYMHSVSKTSLLSEDGPNDAALTRLTCNDKLTITNDREAICVSGTNDRQYVDNVLDACVKLLGATQADMKQDSEAFIAAVVTLGQFSSKTGSGKESLKITDLPLLNAYVEIALLHAFTRGTENICQDAASALKVSGTSFTAGVLITLKEKYETALKSNSKKKLDKAVISTDDGLVMRCGLALEVFASVKERFANCGCMTFTVKHNKLISAVYGAHDVCKRRQNQ